MDHCFLIRLRVLALDFKNPFESSWFVARVEHYCRQLAGVATTPAVALHPIPSHAEDLANRQEKIGEASARGEDERYTLRFSDLPADSGIGLVLEVYEFLDDGVQIHIHINEVENPRDHLLAAAVVMTVWERDGSYILDSMRTLFPEEHTFSVEAIRSALTPTTPARSLAEGLGEFMQRLDRFRLSSSQEAPPAEA